MLSFYLHKEYGFDIRDLTVSDIIKYLHVFANDPPYIETNHVHAIVCAMPRCASTFMTQCISFALDFLFVSFYETARKNIFLHRAGCDGNSPERTIGVSQNLYIPNLVQTFLQERSTVGHHHIIANLQTIKAIKSTNGIVPIVMTRNIPDSLISIRDELLSHDTALTDGGYWQSFSDYAYIFPFLGKPFADKFRGMPLEEQLDVLIDYFLPWYFSFITSWSDFDKNCDTDFCWVHYDEILNDEKSVIKKVCAHLGKSVNDETIDAAIKRVKEAYSFQYNIGKSGRGAAIFSKSQLSTIRNKAELFLSHDRRLMDKFIGL